MNKEKLAEVASAIVASGRGILAADESTPTMGKRLALINQENTEENRRDFRQALFETDGMEQFISGVILFEETLEQKTEDGRRLSEILESNGVYPGIKVDKGAHPMDGSPSEKLTKGLDGLYERCLDYYKLGARFAKWRAVIKISDELPTGYAIHTNAHALARYAKICQEGGLVPIVEPEVLMDGEHDLNMCQHITEETLNSVFGELYAQEVALEGIILKPNMVISGLDAEKRANFDEVADQTVSTLLRCVPAAVPGIMFLSGGQSEIDATMHLNVMNAKYKNLPWRLSYSYGRALQASALKAWLGEEKNIASAQEALKLRSSLNSAACAGQYEYETV